MQTEPSLLVVGESKYGRGAFAPQWMGKGARLIRYTGPLLRYEQTTPQTLAVQIGPDLYLGESGGADDCVNHCCQPNAGLVICGDASVPSGMTVDLIALRDIQPGEEVFFDYSTTMDEDDFEFDCGCGAPNCRGRIGDFKHLPESTRRRYADLGIVPAYNLKYVTP